MPLSPESLSDFMSCFPGSFVGFFSSAAKVLNTLGKDWKTAGEAAWGEVFLNSAALLEKISKDLEKVETEYLIKQELKNASEAPASI